MPNQSQFITHKDYLNWYREYRKNNLDKFREYNRKYIKEWRHKNGYERDKVRTKVFKAIKKGILKRQPCFICDNPLVEAHHPDYSKPLEVIWLCIPHHKEADRILNNRGYGQLHLTIPTVGV